jgi:hypothetical protein
VALGGVELLLGDVVLVAGVLLLLGVVALGVALLLGVVVLYLVVLVPLERVFTVLVFPLTVPPEVLLLTVPLVPRALPIGLASVTVDGLRDGAAALAFPTPPVCTSAVPPLPVITFF